jgi:hypothetical protein
MSPARALSLVLLAKTRLNQGNNLGSEVGEEMERGLLGCTVEDRSWAFGLSFIFWKATLWRYLDRVGRAAFWRKFWKIILMRHVWQAFSTTWTFVTDTSFALGPSTAKNNNVYTSCAIVNTWRIHSKANNLILLTEITTVSCVNHMKYVNAKFETLKQLVRN